MPAEPKTPGQSRGTSDLVGDWNGVLVVNGVAGSDGVATVALSGALRILTGARTRKTVERIIRVATQKVIVAN
jgi:hypothetical protein